MHHMHEQFIKTAGGAEIALVGSKIREEMRFASACTNFSEFNVCKADVSPVSKYFVSEGQNGFF